ncbi:type II secretion system secretin GspD, partial [Pontiella sp.]|uniref:type II secretion system secretin GspD n=1 Tax=Pontiella sp. TaxID=2837462 RepID=UPI0035684591
MVFGQGQPPAAPPMQVPGSGFRSSANTSDAVTPAEEQPAAVPNSMVTKAAPSQKGQLQTFAFEGAPLEVVLEEYCRWTGKTYLKTDAVKASITLKADKLTTEESIKVVEAILAMNNIALVPMGEKYLKVVQATAGDLTGQGLDIQMGPEAALGTTDSFITRIVQLQNVEIPEVQAAVQHVMHSYGKILALQRSNSLMITDTESNVRRALELIEFIDRATAQPESRIYQIQHAEAQEIASKLTEIIDAAQGDNTTATTASTVNRAVRTPPGVIRAGASNNRNQAQTQASVSQTESGSTTIISGTVKVLADDRTNIIIIFSQPENFHFFDEIIQVLDIEVEPATTFEVIHLEYADATDLSGTINDLIGAAGGSSRSTTRSTTAGTTGRTAGSTAGSNSGRVTPNQAQGPGPEASVQNLNRLSEDTKVLADERSNAILLMGSKTDIAVIKELIKQLDIMLEQVVIEAAIFEIGLSDSLSHGIDWLYRAANDERIGAWDGTSLVTNAIGNVASGALTYYQNLTGLDSQVLFNLAAQDSDARLVSTPVIMTTDNTEATLTVAEQRPVVTSTSTYNNSSGTTSSNYEYKDIGIQLTVTPRINPERMVVMELTQSADQLGGSVTIDDNEVPVILNREFTASIAVPDRGTVVLGGLIQTEYEDSTTKIPLLGDIPLIGRYLFSSVSKEEVQRELIVLMTPYVMTDKDQMMSETERIYKGTSLEQKDWGGSWSESPLRSIPDPVEGEEGHTAAASAQTAPQQTDA